MTSFRCIVLMCWLAATASANSLTPGGQVPAVPLPGHEARESRMLVNDGSFEQGTCLNTPVWLCESSNNCDWIADLVPEGLWNYDGNHVAWLGGFCDGVATDYTHICQDVQISWGCAVLWWWWMGYIHEGGSRITVTINDEVVFEKILAPFDHLLDYQVEAALVVEYTGQVVELCFHYDRNGAFGDNYFVDYVEGGYAPTPTERTSFSTVKSMY